MESFPGFSIFIIQQFIIQRVRFVRFFSDDLFQCLIEFLSIMKRLNRLKIVTIVTILI